MSKYVDVESFDFVRVDGDAVVLRDQGIEYRIPARKLPAIIAASQRMVEVYSDALAAHQAETSTAHQEETVSNP